VIEECLNPPLVWEASKGWYTTQPFSDPETFEFPEGIGAVECVNVEHEEVTMLPRSIKAKRFTFKFGLGDFFINALKFLHTTGLDRTQPVAVRTSSGGTAQVSPRDLLCAVLPQPAELGGMMTGKTCAGVLCTGRDKATGARRCVYLYVSRPPTHCTIVTSCACTTSPTTRPACGTGTASAWCGRRPSTP